MKFSYRAEIDGLRAVAVLSVIFYHAGFYFFGGGFVGVDVFFVISGYLIASILIREIDGRDFSIIRFYERRMRRILPALLFILLASLAIGYAFMLPYEYASLGRAAVSVVLFASNILFWRESGYFAAASDLNPLIHTWSLAVEEQFYIVFPPLLWLLSRAGRSVLWGSFLFVFIASLAVAQIASMHWVSANFFLLPSRVWEFAAGGMVALWLLRSPMPRGLVAEITGFVGLISIGVGVFVYTGGTPYPSLFTTLPVLGTVCIILSAGPHTFVGRLLSWRVFVWVGLVSYSAYLWHQPLFAFARIHTGRHELPFSVATILILITFLLSWLSYRFIEQPFRQRGLIDRQRVFSFALAGSVIIVSLGIILMVTDGVPQRFPLGQRKWIATEALTYGDYVRGRYNRHIGRPLSNDRPNLVLVGDSFSQDFFNMISETDSFSNYNVISVYVPARCQVHYGIKNEIWFKEISRGDRLLCSKEYLDEVALEKMRKSDVVIFASLWQPWSAKWIGDSIDAMNLPKSVDFFVVGPKGFEKNRRELLAFSASEAPTVRMPVSEELKVVNKLLRESLPSQRYVDILGEVCTRGCPLFTPDGSMISYDGHHLTKAGAKFIGKIIFSHSVLSRYSTATK